MQERASATSWRAPPTNAGRVLWIRHKIYDRYKDCGIDGLTDRSRRPYRHANQLPMQVQQWVVRLKQEYPSWSAPKIRERLRRRYPELRCPAISTVHAVLDRHDL